MCKPLNGRRIYTTRDTACQTEETMTYHIDYISNNEPCCSLDLEESVLTLDIDRFSEMEKEVISLPFRSRDVDWKLKVQPREHLSRINKTSRCLGVFLQCCPEEETPSNWTCYADFELIMVSKKEGVEDYVRAISHTFNKEEDDWGYSAFLMMKDVSNPACGYIDNDTVTLEVTVRSRALRF